MSKKKLIIGILLAPFGVVLFFWVFFVGFGGPLFILADEGLKGNVWLAVLTGITVWAFAVEIFLGEPISRNCERWWESLDAPKRVK